MGHILTLDVQEMHFVLVWVSKTFSRISCDLSSILAILLWVFCVRTISGFWESDEEEEWEKEEDRGKYDSDESEYGPRRKLEKKKRDGKKKENKEKKIKKEATTMR